MTDFENIYDLYFRDVYHFVLSLSRNERLAEEITQETFFKALKNINNFKGNCKINVWLCQIAKNTYFSHLEKQKKIDPNTIPETASENNVDEMVLKKEDTYQIHKALHEIAEPYKEVFTLRVFGELSFAQIGQLFERTESWARVTFHRAKQKIVDLMKEESL